MADPTTLDQLTLLLRDVFDDDTLVATRDLTARQVNGWHSLGNVRLLVEIERAFVVRFSAAEISSLSNVGQLAKLIKKMWRCVAHRQLNSPRPRDSRGDRFDQFAPHRDCIIHSRREGIARRQSVIN